ncbi:Eukaryotic aspartyl protease family protein [Striga hermonthica]|uniref:Eukaryotic aspartyl protease family protein n=1 Tax=Striga hermonthica TaxID=68872 RepID=A0A9N7RA69_STRHE|nr:Eukaryotic aspartyl protease family protein [Striga hermonthica]
MSLPHFPFSTITYLTLLFAYTLVVLVSLTVEFRIRLTHVDRGKNLSKIVLLRHALDRDQKRLGWLKAATSKSPGKIDFSIYTWPEYLYGDYLTNLSIGTPPQRVPTIISTGTDLTWIQCTSCIRKCPRNSSGLFNTKKSMSYYPSKCPIKGRPHNKCKYNLTYSDGSWSNGELAIETFHFEAGSSLTRKLLFGCGFNISRDLFNGSGVLGLGPTNRSVVSQLGVTEFSYCMPPAGTVGEGVLELGTGAAQTPPCAPTTRLIMNTSTDLSDSFYWIPLEGVKVGWAAPTPVDKLGPTIISTGTTLTHLEKGAFQDVKRNFARHIKLRRANASKIDPTLELCFDVRGKKNINVPKLVLIFDGAKVELPKESYFVVADGIGCLAMAAAEKGEPNMLGNFQQQNMLVAYNIANRTISFVNTQCDDM